jgi:hypothetical protein
MTTNTPICITADCSNESEQYKKMCFGDCGYLLTENTPIMRYTSPCGEEHTLCRECYWDCGYNKDDTNEDNKDEEPYLKQQVLIVSYPCYDTFRVPKEIDLNKEKWSVNPNGTLYIEKKDGTIIEVEPYWALAPRTAEYAHPQIRAQPPREIKISTCDDEDISESDEDPYGPPVRTSVDHITGLVCQISERPRCRPKYAISKRK